MTLSAGIMQELITDAERMGEEKVVQADYIRFLEMEIIQPHAGNTTVLQMTQELGEENPQLREIRLNHMVLAGEMNN